MIFLNFWWIASRSGSKQFPYLSRNQCNQTILEWN
jgi:hypothetical protein